MSGRLIGISILALVIGTGSALSAGQSAGGGSAARRPDTTVLAMDNMGGGGGMMMDNMMTMQPQGQSAQMGGMGGQPSGQTGGGMSTGQGSQGQMGGSGGTQSQGSMGQGGSQMGRGGMMMDDRMRMQQGQSGQGGGMQPQGSGQGSMGQGGAMGQGGMSGQGGMAAMMDNMMRMMSGNMRMGTMPGTVTGWGTLDFTDRIEGRIAFIRAELHITDAQGQTWNAFADAVRSSRQHLIEARQLLNQPYASSAERLERYERHLTERLDALKNARAAFSRLYAMLDDGQKRTADELVVPFIATF